jgi:hypothetical protein
VKHPGQPSGRDAKFQHLIEIVTPHLAKDNYSVNRIFFVLTVCARVEETTPSTLCQHANQQDLGRTNTIKTTRHNIVTMRSSAPDLRQATNDCRQRWTPGTTISTTQAIPKNGHNEQRHPHPKGNPPKLHSPYYLPFLPVDFHTLE